MKQMALCALALAACACVCVLAQTTPAPEDPDRRVSCLPCRPEDAAIATCPVVRPEQCRSGRLTRCGCCDTCVVYLNQGDYCIGAVATNGECKEPMHCLYNQCTNPSRR